MTAAPIRRVVQPRPTSYAEWVESLPDGVEFCQCPGVTWVNRDPRTSLTCPSCGKLRNNDMCTVTSDDPSHYRRRLGCRSVDEAHINNAIWMMTSGQLRGRD